MREPEVEARVRDYLAEQGYTLLGRARPHGPDIIAKKEDKILAVEVKGDRPGHESSPGTINVDVMTLLGQIVLRKSEAPADQHAIGIRPVHRRLIDRAGLVLRELGVTVYLVKDDGSVEEVSGRFSPRDSP